MFNDNRLLIAESYAKTFSEHLAGMDHSVARAGAAQRMAHLGVPGRQVLSTGTFDVEVVGNIAVVPIRNLITQRYTFLTWWYDGTSADMLNSALAQLMMDDSIAGIVLDVDSPGGFLGGLDAVADTLRTMREVMPVMAVSNNMMASAAYWIGSAAGAILVGPDSITGSIGVYAELTSMSRLLDDAGIDVEIIRAGEFKAVPNTLEPITDEGRSIVQSSVDYGYGLFVQAVSLNRQITMQESQKLADGRAYDGTQAIEAGLADAEGSTTEAVAAMAAAGQDVNPSTESRFAAIRGLFGMASVATPASTEGPDVDTVDPEPDPVVASVEAQEDTEALKARLEALETQLAESVAQNMQSERNAREAALQVVRESNAALVGELSASGRIRPSAASGYLAMLNALAEMPEQDQQITYNSGDGNKEVTESMLAFVTRNLSQATQLVPMGSITPEDGVPAASLGGVSRVAGDDVEAVNDLAGQARAYKAHVKGAEGRDISDAEAVEAVLKGKAKV